MVRRISLKDCCLTLSAELLSSSLSSSFALDSVAVDEASSWTGLRWRGFAFPGTNLAFAACLPALSMRFSKITDMRGCVGAFSLDGEVSGVYSLFPGAVGSHLVIRLGRMGEFTAMRMKGDAKADVGPVPPAARIPTTGLP